MTSDRRYSLTEDMLNKIINAYKEILSESSLKNLLDMKIIKRYAIDYTSTRIYNST